MQRPAGVANTDNLSEQNAEVEELGGKTNQPSNQSAKPFPSPQRLSM